MNNMVQKALNSGFTSAVCIDGLKLQCEERLRAYCNPESCPNHGSNWVCPPSCGSLADCANKVAEFNKGILLQSVSIIDRSVPNYKELNREHNFRLREFLEKHCTDMDVLTLTSGGCVLCDVCVYPKLCVKPDIRMNSLSAYGIDVGKLCEIAGFEYSFRPDKVYYVALVLMKSK